MKSIHKAGIKHMDIRADNLVIHPETGKVAIIDFDRAKFPRGNLGDFSGEMECLKDLLKGRFTPDSYR
jgi:serine/threonine protein kinase